MTHNWITELVDKVCDSCGKQKEECEKANVNCSCPMHEAEKKFDQYMEIIPKVKGGLLWQE